MAAEPWSPPKSPSGMPRSSLHVLDRVDALRHFLREQAAGGATVVRIERVTAILDGGQ